MTLTRTRLLQGAAATLAVATVVGGASALYAQTAGTTPTPGGGPPFGMHGGAQGTAPWGGMSGGMPGMMGGRGPMMGAAGMPGIAGVAGHQALLAKLNLTAEQLATERQSGKSLAQIAAARGVDRSTLLSLLAADHQAMVDARLKAGAITQEQASAMTAFMQTRLDEMVDRTEVGPPSWAGTMPGAGAGQGVGPGMGRRGLMGGRRGMGPGAPGTPGPSR